MYEGWGGWQTRDRVKNLRSKIYMLERLGFNASKAQLRELADVRKELDGIQNSCSHFWTVVCVFTHYRQFCDVCDKENTSYDHFKSMKSR